MDKKKGPQLRVRALCRGEGVGYVALGSRATFANLNASATIEGTDETVPCKLFAVRDERARRLLCGRDDQAWIVVVPLVARDCTITLRDGYALVDHVTFLARVSKVASRLLTMRRPEVAAVLRGCERWLGQGDVVVRILEAWPKEGSEAGRAVWRVLATFPTTDGEAHPRLEVYDQERKPVEARVVVMEDHVVPDERDEAHLVRRVTFSCEFGEDIRAFYVVASLGEVGAPGGFDGMNAPRARYLLDLARQKMGGAAADPTYAEWFERHRATQAELERQREVCARQAQDDKPLMSLVMPVYRADGAYLRAAIESVLGQSYDRWELVVVNASGPWPEVDAVLEEVRDERVRVVEVQNRSIAANTNEGIAAAHGDYVGFVDHDDVLEPDALWHYYRAIARDRDVDLLYCDEDHLAPGGVHAPFFKTFPNYGKLYAHNYVTHLLMVSRYALERTERSSDEVSGAQDYDLTLKTFEVARSVAHVPRVLYHWREHAGSTSGGSDQKPFAHEAGRRALAAHLARRGIAARVEDGALPYTYRVRYALGDPQPQVSIVIPTRDHADLLRRCVESILAKSTYERYEIVLVENNSTDARTFALYDELEARDERVRVVTWRPKVPGDFNYSAIVNFGARHAHGELLVLLNNDTEVIEPSWLEEMVGCLMRPEVGVVGAKLLYEDGLIQHVGMAANVHNDFCHVCYNLSAESLGPGYAAAMPGDYAMVTGACQMMRKALYEQLGGYDEDLAVAFNDGDFCLRAREEGYAVTVAAHALLYHREFSSRGREAADVRLRSRYTAEKARVMLKHAAFFAQGDPAFNRNLDRFSPYFELAH